MHLNNAVTQFQAISALANWSFKQLKTVEKRKPNTKKPEKGHGWAKMERIKVDCIRENLKNVGPTFSSLSHFVRCCPEIIRGRYVTLIFPTKDYFSANLKFNK